MICYICIVSAKKLIVFFKSVVGSQLFKCTCHRCVIGVFLLVCVAVVREVLGLMNKKHIWGENDIKCYHLKTKREGIKTERWEGCYWHRDPEWKKHGRSMCVLFCIALCVLFCVVCFNELFDVIRYGLNPPSGFIYGVSDAEDENETDERDFCFPVLSVV